MFFPYLTAILSGDMIVDWDGGTGVDQFLFATLVLSLIVLIVTALLVRRYTKKK